MLLVHVTLIARCPCAEQDSLLCQVEIDPVPECLPGLPLRGPDGTAGHTCPDSGHSVSYSGLAQEFMVGIAYEASRDKQLAPEFYVKEQLKDYKKIADHKIHHEFMDFLQGNPTKHQTRGGDPHACHSRLCSMSIGYANKAAA